MRTPDERRDFFISFNSADRDYAEWIAKTLEDFGHSVFFQHWDFRPGNNFVLEMDRAARLAERIIAVLSESYLMALFPQPEWARFFAEDPTGSQRKLIPVRISDCDVDGFLRNIVYIDLVGCDKEESRERLRTGVKLGRAKPVEVPFPQRGALAPRRVPEQRIQEQLPSREAELQYLDRLIQEEEVQAAKYWPLQARRATSNRPNNRRRACADHADIALLRLRSPQGTQAERTQVRDYEDILSAFTEWKQKSAGPKLREQDQTASRSAEVCAILGEPGAGKSTTLRRLGVGLARVAKVQPGSELPMLAYLGNWTGDATLTEFLTTQAPEVGWAVGPLSRSGRLVLMLDGLNEAPTHLQTNLALAIRELAKELGSGTKVLVSCRTKDYIGDLDLGGDTFTIEPLSAQRIRAVLRHWMSEEERGEVTADSLFWQLAGDEGLAFEMETWVKLGNSEEAFWEGDLSGFSEFPLRWKHLHDSRSLLKLCSNPFLLNMLFLVWDSEGHLPTNRGDLFERFIDRLLYREKLVVHDPEIGEWSRTPEGERLLRGLSELAWSMQRTRMKNQTDWSDFGVLTTTDIYLATDALGTSALLRKSLDASLLESIWSHTVRFCHQLLQEYFTARALLQRMQDMTADELWPPTRWWGRTGWEETLVLLSGFHPEGMEAVFRWLSETQPQMAAQCMLDTSVGRSCAPEFLGEIYERWIPRLSDTGVAPEMRASYGRALARLGLDDRRGTGVIEGIPDIDWVLVKGGAFDDTLGGRRVYLESFEVAKYPVTVAQFDAFVNAEDGFPQDQWWNDVVIEESDDFWDFDPRKLEYDWVKGREHYRYKLTEGNHPVTHVSWYQATAFCLWLSNQLGFTVRLPMTTEWEWTAFGESIGLNAWWAGYSSGDANVDETRCDLGPHFLGRTSPVGVYPASASRNGVMDLLGNVQEWCFDEEASDEPIAREIATAPVRGGSWKQKAEPAGFSYRSVVPKYSISDSIGFRIVRANRIQSSVRNCMDAKGGAHELGDSSVTC